jgi:hypothetical protein
MNRKQAAWAALTGMALAADPASANVYRIYYQGSEAVAVASAVPTLGAPVAAVGAVQPAGYFGAPPAAAVGAVQPVAGYQGVPPAIAAVPGPPPANLSVPCPTCIPGGSPSANFGAGVPNQIVTFMHPYTGKAITIPMTLPVGRPKIITRPDRIIYDYGPFGYRATVKFEPNGRAEVKYRD